MENRVLAIYQLRVGQHDAASRIQCLSQVRSLGSDSEIKLHVWKAVREWFWDQQSQNENNGKGGEGSMIVQRSWAVIQSQGRPQPTLQGL